MKKIVTLMLAAGLISAVSAAEPHAVPYASGLYQDSEWTVVDVNNDGKTWADNATSSYYSESGFTSGKQYSYHSSNEGNDWLISPAVTLEAGKEYKAKYWVNTRNYNESMKLTFADAGDVDALAAGTVLTDFTASKAYPSMTKVSAVFTVPTTGNYYFGFLAYSPKNMGWINLTGFEVCENVFAPATVSKLTCTAGEDYALEATLAWELPTTDNDGAALPDDAEFNNVIIKRDGAEVATIAGDATIWTDTESTGLTPGYHTYEVAVVVNSAQSAFTSVASKYIGPVEAMTLPYDANIKTLTKEEFELFWTPVKGRASTSTANWEFKTTYSGNYIQYCGGSGKEQDDWIISPQMKFEQPGVYKLSVNLSYSSSIKTNFDILLGTGNSIGGYETVIRNFTSIPSTYTDYEIFFTVETPGEYGIAFHANTTTGSYYTYYLKNFVVEKWQMTPAHVADLTATVSDDATTVALSWTNPTTTNTGDDLTDLTKVELYADGALLETFSTVAPGAPMSYDHLPATSGAHEYYVLPYGSEGAADGDPVKVKSAWVGDETQTLPYTSTFSAADVTTPIWSGFNANDDNAEWIIKSTGATLAVDKTQNYGHKNDDYLLSPYFNLTPGYYSAIYSIKGAGKNVKLQIGLTADKKDVAATFTPAETVTLPGQTWTTDYKVLIHVTAGGKYAFTLRNNTMASTSDYDLVVTKVQFAYLPVAPSVATDLTVIPAADLSNSATVSWTNPTTTNIEGVAPELVKAVIARNGEEIGEVTEGLIPGETSSYEDTTVPNAGEYTYTVTIHGPEGASTAKPAEVKSPWIGAGLDLPFDCADSFREAGWNIYNVNNDKYSWGDPITWEANSSSIYISSNNTTPDDWAITPRLNFVEGGKYIVTIQSYYSNGYSAVSWDLHFGSSITPESMTQKLATINTASPSADKQTDVFYLEVPDAAEAMFADEADETEETEETKQYIAIPAGVGTLGLHANQKGAFNVSGFSVKAEETLSISEVEEPAEGIFVCGDEIFFGSAAKAKVHDLAGRCIMTAEGASRLSLAGLGRGVYIVTADINGTVSTIKVTK